ncbi:threonylcarbamoyl-AMP synthase [Streptomonospora sp. S1-112]|uniref:L-threonylcarbamoyladenylate synthase n=1 Tax=Streptomonospora mangrovi TaxID=2883123 RepID=A0A9X3NZD6_9ACTN|nr:L-threonylcarbamoyladenylate synthase [Streptomonospora mangrovi]MDA0567156.1 threonylcarbamoyl-AMP synthase [Streptomonospora mangrovi]
MSRSYDCADVQERRDGIADAASSVRRGELVVLPTDTVYGIGTDAFSPGAVSGLLQAKGRGRDMPPPVLVGSVRAAQALIEDLGNYGQDLIEEFWPGPLTIVCTAAQSLSWDLGDTKGTVAVRMPMHPVALDLLKEVGPMAVSSANLSGQPAAITAQDAEKMLGDSVAVYLDGGPCADQTPSTIVDLTYAVPRVLRDGAIPVERLRAVCGTVIGVAKRTPTTAPESVADDSGAPGTAPGDTAPEGGTAGAAGTAAPAAETGQGAVPPPSDSEGTGGAAPDVSGPEKPGGSTP